MIGCLRTRVRNQPIIALYFESENVLKLYNLEARKLNKFTLFSCLLLIAFVSCLDQGQRRQNVGPGLDSTGPDLDLKHSTPWL